MTQPVQNAAIYYQPSGYSTSGEKLMGRHAAGEGFLTAMARHASAPELIAFTSRQRHFDDFRDRIAELSGGARTASWIPERYPERLTALGALFRPDPEISASAWARRHHDQRGYSLIGITHTISSDRAMRMFGEFMTAPLQSWDAIICTSDVVRATVTGAIERYGEYLAQRLGASEFPSPQFPVVPLGIDSGAFAPSDDSSSRGQAYRRELGIADDEIVLLFLGRLSFHAKAHPMPNFLAAEEVARRTGMKLRLVFAGWAANEHIDKAFRDSARLFAPSVETTFLDGREARVRRDVWHAADIFMSLSDNIQETFGLAPLEAMAAGLPVLVSDWDGYRQTVRDGVDGIMVPSWTPPPGAGGSIARAFMTQVENYDQYVANTSQMTAMDLKATADALETLAGNADLRKRMGEAGRARAADEFDWRIIIGKYEALWAELAERRNADAESAARMPDAPASPLNDDPFRLFESYPTYLVDAATPVRLMEGADVELLRVRMTGGMNNAAPQYLPDVPALESAIAHLAEGGDFKAGDLAEVLTRDDDPDGAHFRALAWLAKIGIVHLGD